MKRSILLIAAALLVGTSGVARAQETKPAPRMAQYFVVVLRTGTRGADADSATLARIRTGHMNNIRAMGKEGKLLTAGPVGGAPDVQGIFVFVPGLTKAEIETLIKRDPAIAEGFLVAEFWQWYSPAGLQVVLEGAERSR